MTIDLEARIRDLERRIEALEDGATSVCRTEVAPPLSDLGIATRYLDGTAYVSEPDAARLVGISPRTLRNWYFDRGLKAVRINNRRHYTLDVIIELVER